LLRTAGRTDPVMRDVQDAFFEQEFFAPAMRWAKDHGFTLPLSALVVYDSFIHSGSILPLIRRSFPERTSDAGGDERAWTTAYVKARHIWLVEHSRSDVRRTQYRTRCLSEQINRLNWNLEVKPIRANGVVVG
jgi:chitosanase